MDISNCKDIKTLRRLVAFRQKEFNERNVAAAASSILQLISKNPSNMKNFREEIKMIFAELIFLIGIHIDKMGVRELTNCLWAFGKSFKLLKFDRDLERSEKTKYLKCFGQLSKKCAEKKDEMNAWDVQQAMLAMGWVDWRKKDEFLILLEQTKKLGPEQFNAQGICNVLQSAAKVNIYDLNLIKIFLEDAKKRLDEFDSYGIGLLMRQIKDFRYYDEEFLDMVKYMIEQQQLRTGNLEVGWSIISAFAAFSSIKMDTKNAIAILQEQFEFIEIKNDFYTIGILCDHVLNLSILGTHLQSSHKICQNIEYFLKENEEKNQDHPNLFQLQQAKFFYAIQDLKLILPEDLEIASTVSTKLTTEKLYQQNLKSQYQQKTQLQQQQQNNNNLQINSLNERIFQYVYNYFKDREDVLVAKQFPLNQIGLCVDILIIHVKFETIDEKTGQNQVKVQKKVAIQVENTSSYTLNQPYRLLATRQKFQQLLVQFGWAVIALAFYEKNDEDFHKKIVQNVKNIIQM